MNLTRHDFLRRLKDCLFFQNKDLLSTVFFSFSIAWFLYIFVTLVRFMNTDFTNDEISLLLSIQNVKFSFCGVSPLTYEQSAPFLYVGILKTLMSVFGTNYMTGRVFSFLIWNLLVLSLFIFLNNIFKSRWKFLAPLAAVVIPSLPVVLRYSCIFKPYILDCFCLFLIITAYYFYLRNRLPCKYLTLLCCLVLWLSSPSCFFVGGVLIMETVTAIILKDKRRFMIVLLSGLVVLTSFSLHYFLWLGNQHTEYMTDFWKWNNFPITDFRGMKWIIFKFFGTEYGIFRKILVYLVFGGIITSFYQCRNIERRALLAGVTALGLALIASSIGKYPISYRLFLFIYPLSSILALVFVLDLIDVISASKKYTFPALILFFSLCLFLTRDDQGIYQKDFSQRVNYGNMVAEALDEIHKYSTTNPIIHLWVDIDIFHPENFPMMKLPQDIHLSGYPLSKEVMIEYKEKDLLNDCWIILKIDNGIGECYEDEFYHDNVAFDFLPDNGFRELFFTHHNVSLYHYVSRPSDLKTRVKYNLLNVSYDDDWCEAEIALKNTGPAVINSSSELLALCVEGTDYRLAIPRNITPKEVKKIRMRFPCHGKKEFKIQLIAVGKYSYEELGIAPLTISIPTP